MSDAGRVVAYTTAVFFIAAGTIHVSAAADHENLPAMLVGFLGVATAQAAFGGLLLWRRPGRLLLLAGLALMLGALGTWLVSRTLGLPFLRGGHMEPIGFKDGVTVLFELASIPGLLLLMSRELGRVSLPSPRLGSSTVAGFSAAAFALFVPALMLGGGEHHSAAELAAGGHSHGDGRDQLAASDHAHAGSRGEGKAARRGRAHDHATASATPLARDPSGGTGHEHAAGGEQGADGGGATGGGGGHHGGDDGARGDGGHDDTGGHGGGGRAGDDHGGGDHGGGGHPDHGAPEEGGSANNGVPTPNEPGGLWWGAHRLDYEPARAGEDGEVGSGYAFVYRGPPDPNQGTVGHHSDEPCQPTADQQAAADQLYQETNAVMRRYDNAPQRAVADGFVYAFPVTDRITHMVSPRRVWDPTILTADAIESFLYVMTDRGLVAVGGMYVMPDPDTPGPQIGGCLTRWHRHTGLAGRAVSAGTTDRTAEMLHVWTYPGLKPYSHYDGRSLSQLWTPGSIVPSLCRQTGDASDVCLP